MSNPVTVLAPIRLAPGKSEADLLEASAIFQRDFAGRQPGLIRRELVRRGDGSYLDIVQFRSVADALAVMEQEKTSAACQAFFAIMDPQAGEDAGCLEFHQSLATYHSLADANDPPQAA